MEKENVSIFVPSILAIILGVALFRKFDFETLKFEKTGLAIVYLIGFIISIALLVRALKSK